jgi:arachidonate 15-lipoxygenase
VRRLIWIAGPQHAAVNYPQPEYAMFIPNMPAATYGPPIDGPVDAEALLATLSPRAETKTQVQVSCIAGYHYDRLLQYDLCSSDESQALVQKFLTRLRTQVQPVIEARNAERAKQPGLVPYPYFLPENIPNSTSA